MPLWYCDIDGCAKPTVRLISIIIYKDHARYFPALRKAEDNEFSAFCSKINIEALKTRASELRNGIECSIEPIQHGLMRRCHMGGMNYHVEIMFEDGCVWFARIRRLKATSPPRAVRDYILTSEVATLMFLDKTIVPASGVYGYAREHSDNLVGIGYILMEKLPGKPLDWPAATPDQGRKVMDQLADLQIEVSKHPLPALGSLNTPGSAEVGGFAHEMLLSVTGSWLDLVPKLTPGNPHDNGNFYLKHGDDKGEYIWVDENFNITGVIDWELAHTAAPADAFNSPIGLLPVAD
ncbi:hypothetical protein PWT90_10439 [Aphanocladium album]|nr:hypothetical protein PWT90_10439 [Aphanocladium album]